MSFFHCTWRLLLLGASASALAAADPSAPESVPSRSEPVIELDELVVRTTPFGRTAEELTESASILAGPRLALRRSASLGETLDGTPGVSSTYFGPGASRPLIRGLGGERIRILTNALGTSDVSGTSPDHAVGLDPALIDRIEVFRGPAALLYGSSAVGGLVNVISDQIPGERPATSSGFVDGSYGFAADEKSGVLHTRGPAGNAAWQVSLQRRRSNDVAIPGFAEIRPKNEERSVHGVLPNSAIDTKSGSAGTSWFWSRGFLGAAISGMDSRYGIPGHGHGEEPPAGAEGPDYSAGVVIDLHQRRFDTQAEIRDPFPGFSRARWRLGVADYRHLELEGGEIGTRFDRDSWETRMDLLHAPLGPLEGAVGFQLQRTSLVAAGEEAFLPPTRTRHHAVFALEEIAAGAVRWQLGGRWEKQQIAVRTEENASRRTNAVSVSAGGLWTITPVWSLGVAVARTERAPTAQELFADGPHAATQAFEIGDPNLAREGSTGLDVSLRRAGRILSGALTVFVNDFAGFITAQPGGETIDHLPVLRYTAHDARFAGAEWETTWHLHHAGLGGVELTFTADAVHATDRTTAEPLPRIPPARAGLMLSYESARWSAGAELRWNARQSRVAPNEAPSHGYVLLGAYASRRIPLERSALQLFVRVSNATDEEARPHTSFLKDIAPLPGRNVTLGARWEY